MIRNSRAALAGAGAALGLIAFAGQAAALTYTATYKGVVSDISYQGRLAGLFGAGADGASFTAVFTWNSDDAIPGFSVDDPGVGSQYYSYGMTGTISFGDFSASFQDPGAGDTHYAVGIVSQAYDPSVGGIVVQHAVLTDAEWPDRTDSTELALSAAVGPLASWDWRTPTTYDLTGLETGGFVGFYAYDIDPVTHRTLARNAAQGQLNPISLVVTAGPGAAVPEPAAWALMILGFGGAGALLRRRSLRVGAA